MEQLLTLALAQSRQLYILHGYGCFGHLWGIGWRFVLALEHGTVEALVQAIMELGHAYLLERKTLAKRLLNLLPANLLLHQDLVLVQAIAEGNGASQLTSAELDDPHLAANGAFLTVVLRIGGILVARLLEDRLQIGRRELLHPLARVELLDASQRLGVGVELLALLLLHRLHNDTADAIEVVLGHTGGHPATRDSRTRGSQVAGTRTTTDAVAVVVVVLAATQLRVHIVRGVGLAAHIVLGLCGCSCCCTVYGSIPHHLHVRHGHLLHPPRETCKRSGSESGEIREHRERPFTFISQGNTHRFSVNPTSFG